VRRIKVESEVLGTEGFIWKLEDSVVITRVAGETSIRKISLDHEF
jgi:hypothetical protein